MTNRKERALVTGGTGFIGSYLVRHLMDLGHSVRVLDNNFRGRPTRLGNCIHRVEMVEGDICDAATVHKATEGMDWVFHLAFINGTRHFYEIPHKILEVGIKGALNTIEAAIAHKVKKYIVASSAEVYQEPTHVPTTETERLIIPDIRNARYSYGGGKIVCELLAMHMAPHYGLPTVIFRPHNIYGPDMGNEHVIPQFIRRMLDLREEKGKDTFDFPIQGTGEETRAFCYAEDAARGIALCAEKGGDQSIYHIGNPEEVTIRNLADRIATCLGFRIKVVPGELAKGSTPRRCPSIEKAGKELGYSPRVTLDQGLRQTCEWHLRQRKEKRT